MLFVYRLCDLSIVFLCDGFAMIVISCFIMGHPIQIISFGCDRKLKLNNTEFEKIVSRDDVQGLPIAILSVIGAFRTGKSFLLNWIERFLSSDEKVKSLVTSSSRVRYDYKKLFTIGPRMDQGVQEQ